jgi:1-acyl-sn-glycerol-3-phosphate acyltransferase
MWKLLIDASIEERVRRLELPFNRYGYDHFGVSQQHLAAFYTLLSKFYHSYFSIRAEGLENIPARGRAMLVGNHSGGVAFDGGMIIASAFFDKEPPRLVQGMVEKFMNSVPFTAPWMYRAGQFTGLPENATRLLDNERLLLVFPEGARGTAKLYKERNSLVRFGTGFMRLALQTGAPIIPFAFSGGGDIFPTVRNLYTLGKLVGAPYIPLTKYVVPLPLPKPCEIYYGEPLYFEGDGREDDDVIESYVAKVRGSINDLVTVGCENRNMSEDAMRASGWLPTEELLADEPHKPAEGAGR